MNCRRSTLKKYKSRPSPPFPAQDCKSKKKKGNDGAMYQSVADSSGVYRWRPLETKKQNKGVKEYMIHDNGGRPFRVAVGKTSVDVYLNEWENQFIRGKQVFHTPYKRIFIGDNDLRDPMAEFPKGKARGNSILVHVNANKYIYIGHYIYSFETQGDTIQKYFSPVGNNDVPYPYAIGDEYVYFMLDCTTVPKNVFDLKRDAYTQYYGYPFPGEKREDTEAHKKNVIQPLIKAFKSKVIHKRR